MCSYFPRRLWLWLWLRQTSGDALTDSTTLKAGIVGTTRQLDGTVQVDILALHQGFVNGELCIAWGRSQEQLSDPCTKGKADVTPLMTTFNTRRLIFGRLNPS
jgi:hypothetical protein